MRLLHFADLHLDTPFRWAGPELARRRRQGLRDSLRTIVDLAASTGVEAVLCAGDLYEQDYFSPDTGAFLRDAFALLHPLPIYIAPGNHDWYGPRSLYGQGTWSPNVHVFASSRLEPVPLRDGLTLWGAAHRAPAGTAGFLRDFEVDRGGVHLALFHGSERLELELFGEGRDAHAPFEAGELVRAGIHHAFCGHYHRPRDAERHTYPGNPAPLAFGESGERGAVVATIGPDGSVARQRHAVAANDAHDLTLDVSGCASAQAVRELLAARLQGRSGVARATLVGELAPQIDLPEADLRSAAPWMEAVLPRVGRLHAAYDLDALAAEQTVRGELVRAVRASGLDEDDRRRVILTGLRALDGRLDLGAI
jgi:DNA repair protein SbcD/Mre11